MKTLFAVLAIFISPTLAFGDTIGPSTGCANSACLGNNYTLTRYSGDQLSIHYIIDSKGFRDIDVERTDRIDHDIGGTLESETDVWKFLLTTDGLDSRDSNDIPRHFPKGAAGSLGTTAVPES